MGLYVDTRSPVHDIRALAGGPSARPAPSHSLGNIGGCPPAGLSVTEFRGMGLRWQADIPQRVLNVALEVRKAPATTAALTSPEPSF